MSNLISDLAALLRQRSNKTTKRTFTTNFEFDLISYEIEKFDETFVTICKQHFIDVRVKLMIKNKTFNRQIIELKKLYNENDN